MTTFILGLLLGTAAGAALACWLLCRLMPGSLLRAIEGFIRSRTEAPALPPEVKQS
jgi:hypothetical protein